MLFASSRQIQRESVQRVSGHYYGKKPSKGSSMRTACLTLSVLFFGVVFMPGGFAYQIKKKDRDTPKPPPTTPRTGELTVITDPPSADVIVRKGRTIIKKGPSSKDGKFTIKVPGGAYDITVSKAGYSTWNQDEVIVKLAREETVRAELKPLTGSIMIGPLEDDAKILIDGKSPENIKKTRDRAEIAGVSEGEHTVRVEDPDYLPFEEKVKVEGGASRMVLVTKQAAVVKFIIRSQPGATVLINGNNVGQVQPDGTLKVAAAYPAGQYTIRAELDKFEPGIESGNYKPGEVTVEVRLTKFKSSPELGEFFRDGKSFWDAPAQWSAAPGKLTVTGSGVGLVKGYSYDDFTMTFDVVFANGKGAAWIIRARDKQNFYLFQITGSGATGPKTFRSFMYKNGQLSQLSPAVAIVEDLGRPGDSFVIKVEARGNSIRHFITVNNNPRADDPQPLGFITDNDNTFSHGAIGFTSKDGEEFIVQFVNVKPEQPPAR